MADEKPKTNWWRDNGIIVGVAGLVVAGLGGMAVLGIFLYTEQKERLQNLEKDLITETNKRVFAEKRADSLSVLINSKIVLPDSALFPENEAIPVLGGEVTIVCDSVVGTLPVVRARIRVISNDKTFKGISNTNVYKGDRRYFFFRGKKYILNVLGVKDYRRSDISVYKEVAMRQLGVKIRIYQAEEQKS